jgi:hypothetical protein
MDEVLGSKRQHERILHQKNIWIASGCQVSQGSITSDSAMPEPAPRVHPSSKTEIVAIVAIIVAFRFMYNNTLVFL